jgi:hypothetical protein
MVSADQQQLSLRHNVQGTVYVLHFDPPYKHAQHYVGWTEGDVIERIAVHLQGRGSPLIRAAVAAGVYVQLAIGAFRDWLAEYMSAHELTAADVARCIGRDQEMVRG